MNYDYELFVIGAGSGGVATARRAASYGARVGIAEHSRLGGTCVNRGCVPKKLMVYASRFPDQLEEARGYGWSPVQSPLDWPHMIAAVNGETERLNGVYQTMLEKVNVELFRARASLVDSHTVNLGDRQVTAEKILIAVGGKPVKPQTIPGIEAAITSDDIFHLPEQPKHLVVLGGGYIGIEFACILKGLGSEVTVVIRADRILRGFDSDLRNEIQGAMERHGIRVLNNSKEIAIEKTANGVGVKLRREGCEETVGADAVSLAALGRKPNIEGLGLENTKVELAKKGAIVVDPWSQTADPSIYAVGDVTDRINLTPVAIAEGRAFADTHFGGMTRQMAYDNIPTAVFTTPEAGTVGLTEEEAIAQYGEDRIQIYRTRFRAMYYVLPGKNEEKTLMKLVVDKETQKILGAHMVGDHAGEIIQGIAIAVKMGATKGDFDATVGIHPTSAEEFVTIR